MNKCVTFSRAWGCVVVGWGWFQPKPTRRPKPNSKKKLEPRLEEAKAGKRAVYFVDAAHFVLGAYVGFLWCFEPLFIQSGAGRKRFNVLAALNAMSHEMVMITNETYINALSVCDLLNQLAALALSIPITLVLDNARYQKGAVVSELAAQLGIELLGVAELRDDGSRHRNILKLEVVN